MHGLFSHASSFFVLTWGIGKTNNEHASDRMSRLLGPSSRRFKDLRNSVSGCVKKQAKNISADQQNDVQVQVILPLLSLETSL